MNHDTVEANLAKLRNAVPETEKLLYGNLAGMACCAVAQPDLRALKSHLAKLTATLGFDCFELAKILTCGVTLPSKSTPIHDAAHSLLHVELPPELQGGRAGLAAITSAVQSGDAEFFIQLGGHLSSLLHPRKPAKGQPIYETAKWSLEFGLGYLWQPHGTWPGLAYCKNSARRDFLNDCCGHGNLGKRYFDTLWRRLGLVSAKRPFVSRIKQGKFRLQFS